MSSPEKITAPSIPNSWERWIFLTSPPIPIDWTAPSSGSSGQTMNFSALGEAEASRDVPAGLGAVDHLVVVQAGEAGQVLLERGTRPDRHRRAG